MARLNRKVWKGSVADAVISAAGVSDTVVEVGIRDGASNLWATVENGSGGKLDDFDVWVQTHSDSSYVNLGASVASDYIALTPRWPIRRANVDPKTLAASTNFILSMDVKGLYAVKLTASGSVATTVSAYWQTR